jgi:hypothetical protein
MSTRAGMRERSAAPSMYVCVWTEGWAEMWAEEEGGSRFGGRGGLVCCFACFRVEEGRGRTEIGGAGGVEGFDDWKEKGG